MKKFFIGLVTAGVFSALGFHYWALRWNLQTTQFKVDLFEAEHRILRDELAELRGKKTYEQGVFDTIIRSKLDTSFQDGLFTAFSVLPKENQDVVSAYHRAIEHTWANVYYNEQMNKKKLETEKENSYISGRKDGYDDAVSDIATMKSHDDFDYKVFIKKELSPFKVVEETDNE